MLQVNDNTIIPKIPASLTDLGIVDCPPEKEFDNLTRFALKMIGAPVALISIVQEECDRQFFKSQQGLPEPWATMRQTPLSHSFCQYVKRNNEVLVVENAPENELVRSNLAIRDLNVIAYLGVPIHDPAKNPIGALCVIDQEPRAWTDDEVSIMHDLAACVSDQILLRASLQHSETLHDKLKDQFARSRRYNALRESVSMAFMVPDMSLSDRFRLMLQSGCDALGMENGCIAEIEGDTVCINFANDEKTETSEFTATTMQRLLMGNVIAGQEQVCLQDTNSSRYAGKKDVLNREPASYIAAPLILNGTIYGAIEFSSMQRKNAPCTGEEQSIISMIAMLTCANLEAYRQLRHAKIAESQILSNLLDERANSRQLIENLKRANG